MKEVSMKGKSTYLTVGLAVLALVVAAPAGAKLARHALFAHAAAGTGAFGPGCTTGGDEALCDSRSFVFHLAAISGFSGTSAFGYFDRTNVANGNTFAGAVTCLSVSAHQAAVGGFVTRTPGGSGAGVPFLVYVLDNGRLGGALADGISPFAIVGPEETPVAGFPYVCPSPASPLGYHSLTSGDIVVLGG
jgi:hypothetical protein